MNLINWNLNYNVKVKLTPTGVKHYINYYKQFNIETTPKIDQDGYAKFQMWGLMNIYGKEMWMGNPNYPFQMNVKIEVEENELN